MDWETTTKSKYDAMLNKIPLFHRTLTDEIVQQKAPALAQERGVTQVEEEDVIKAFLTEVPKCFYSMMTRLMDDVGFEYKQYE